MARTYEKPDLRVFDVATEELVANSCKPIYNGANGPGGDCLLAHTAHGNPDCHHKGGPYTNS